jgi:hypothetical protein
VGLFKSIGKAFSGIGKGLASIGKSAFKAVGAVVKTSVGVGGRIVLPSVLGVASGGIGSALLGGVVGKIFPGPGSAPPILDAGKDKGVLGSIWDGVKETASTFGQRVADSVSGAVDRAQEFAQDAAVAAGRALADIGAGKHYKTKVVIWV